MGHIQMKVFAVIDVYDRFLGISVKEELVYTLLEPEQKVIRKGNGRYVLLCHPGVEEQVITFQASQFLPCTLRIQKETDSSCAHFTLWMEPGEHYSYPYHTTFIFGKSKKKDKRDSMIVTFGTEGKNIRLLKDYKKGELCLALYGTQKQVQGTEYILYQNGMPASEIFMIKDADNEICCLREPLHNSYKKTDVQVRRVYRFRPDDNGNFKGAFLLEKERENDNKVVLCDILGEDGTHKEYQIELGQKNEMLLE